MLSPRHEQLIARFEVERATSWIEECLASCLRRLRDGGLTEWRDITVVDAWTEDGFMHVVYQWSYLSETFGYRGQRPTDMGDMTAVEYGVEVADFFIAEPLGTRFDTLAFDANGIGWWGELPGEAA